MDCSVKGRDEIEYETFSVVLFPPRSLFENSSREVFILKVLKNPY